MAAWFAAGVAVRPCRKLFRTASIAESDTPIKDIPNLIKIKKCRSRFSYSTNILALGSPGRSPEVLGVCEDCSGVVTLVGGADFSYFLAQNSVSGRR